MTVWKKWYSTVQCWNCHQWRTIPETETTPHKCSRCNVVLCTAVILHPDHEVRDVYGVISRGMLEYLRVHGESYILGYFDGSGRKPGYADLRDMFHGLVDLPDVLCCELALFLSHVEHYDREWYHQPHFKPIL